jgi:hypothetical protein
MGLNFPTYCDARLGCLLLPAVVVSSCPASQYGSEAIQL